MKIFLTAVAFLGAAIGAIAIVLIVFPPPFLLRPHSAGLHFRPLQQAYPLDGQSHLVVAPPKWTNIACLRCPTCDQPPTNLNGEMTR